MTLAEMAQEVKNIVNDESYDSSVVGYINESFLQASGEINIPDLKRIAIATTVEDQMYTSLVGITDGFNGRLVKLFDSTIARFDNVESLITQIQEDGRELTENGDVEYVALEGKTLWYFPIPKPAQDLTCLLFTNPPVLEDDEDVPTAFPEICHRNIGVHGAVKLIFAAIEDGLETDKPNTSFHTGMYNNGVQQLREWIGRHRVHFSTSTLNVSVSTQFPRGY